MAENLLFILEYSLVIINYNLLVVALSFSTFQKLINLIIWQR